MKIPTPTPSPVLRRTSSTPRRMRVLARRWRCQSSRRRWKTRETLFSGARKWQQRQSSSRRVAGETTRVLRVPHRHNARRLVWTAGRREWRSSRHHGSRSRRRHGPQAAKARPAFRRAFTSGSRSRCRWTACWASRLRRRVATALLTQPPVEGLRRSAPFWASRRQRRRCSRRSVFRTAPTRRTPPAWSICQWTRFQTFR
mmetsp:Transcript_109313/g.308490  ORF Transcript_109313/g.308490 Transcript_109313/m.308490 type:complete len:200 (-) Transcript_109313:362-961(-)